MSAIDELRERAKSFGSAIDCLRQHVDSGYPTHASDSFTRLIAVALIELDERLRKVEDAIRQLPGRERALSQFDEVKA